MYLGDDMSPKEILRASLAREIWAMRKQGKSDFEIRAYLLRPPVEGHPCRGPSAEQLCTVEDIDAAFPEADIVKKKEEEMKRKPILTLKNAAIAAAVAVAALVIFVPKPKRK